MSQVYLYQSQSLSHHTIASSFCMSPFIASLLFILSRNTPDPSKTNYPNSQRHISCRLVRSTLTLSNYINAMATSSAPVHIDASALLHIQLILRAPKGPNELSVNCADAVQPILGAGGLPKGPCKSSCLFLVSASQIETPQTGPTETQMDTIHQSLRRSTQFSINNAAGRGIKHSALQPSRTTKTLSLERPESYLITSRNVQDSKLIFPCG